MSSEFSDFDDIDDAAWEQLCIDTATPPAPLAAGSDGLAVKASPPSTGKKTVPKPTVKDLVRSQNYRLTLQQQPQSNPQPKPQPGPQPKQQSKSQYNTPSVHNTNAKTALLADSKSKLPVATSSSGHLGAGSDGPALQSGRHVDTSSSFALANESDGMALKASHHVNPPVSKKQTFGGLRSSLQPHKVTISQNKGTYIILATGFSDRCLRISSI